MDSREHTNMDFVAKLDLYLDEVHRCLFGDEVPDCTGAKRAAVNMHKLARQAIEKVHPRCKGGDEFLQPPKPPPYLQDLQRHTKESEYVEMIAWLEKCAEGKDKEINDLKTKLVNAENLQHHSDRDKEMELKQRYYQLGDECYNFEAKIESLEKELAATKQGRADREIKEAENDYKAKRAEERANDMYKTLTHERAAHMAFEEKVRREKVAVEGETLVQKNKQEWAERYYKSSLPEAMKHAAQAAMDHQRQEREILEEITESHDRLVPCKHVVPSSSGERNDVLGEMLQTFQQQVNDIAHQSLQKDGKISALEKELKTLKAAQNPNPDEAVVELKKLTEDAQRQLLEAEEKQREAVYLQEDAVTAQKHANAEIRRLKGENERLRIGTSVRTEINIDLAAEGEDDRREVWWKRPRGGVYSPEPRPLPLLPLLPVSCLLETSDPNWERRVDSEEVRGELQRRVDEEHRWADKVGNLERENDQLDVENRRLMAGMKRRDHEINKLYQHLEGHPTATAGGGIFRLSEEIEALKAHLADLGFEGIPPDAREVNEDPLLAELVKEYHEKGKRRDDLLAEIQEHQKAEAAATATDESSEPPSRANVLHLENQVTTLRKKCTDLEFEISKNKGDIQLGKRMLVVEQEKHKFLEMALRSYHSKEIAKQLSETHALRAEYVRFLTLHQARLQTFSSRTQKRTQSLRRLTKRELDLASGLASENDTSSEQKQPTESESVDMTDVDTVTKFSEVLSLETLPGYSTSALREKREEEDQQRPREVETKDLNLTPIRRMKLMDFEIEELGKELEEVSHNISVELTLTALSTEISMFGNEIRKVEDHALTLELSVQNGLVHSGTKGLADNLLSYYENVGVSAGKILATLESAEASWQASRETLVAVRDNHKKAELEPKERTQIGLLGAKFADHVRALQDAKAAVLANLKKEKEQDAQITAQIEENTDVIRQLKLAELLAAKQIADENVRDLQIKLQIDHIPLNTMLEDLITIQRRRLDLPRKESARNEKLLQDVQEKLEELNRRIDADVQAADGEKDLPSQRDALLKDLSIRKRHVAGSQKKMCVIESEIQHIETLRKVTREKAMMEELREAQIDAWAAESSVKSDRLIALIDSSRSPRDLFALMAKLPEDKNKDQDRSMDNVEGKGSETNPVEALAETMKRYADGQAGQMALASLHISALQSQIAVNAAKVEDLQNQASELQACALHRLQDLADGNGDLALRQRFADLDVQALKEAVASFDSVQMELDRTKKDIRKLERLRQDLKVEKDYNVKLSVETMELGAEVRKATQLRAQAEAKGRLLESDAKLERKKREVADGRVREMKRVYDERIRKIRAKREEMDGIGRGLKNWPGAGKKMEDEKEGGEGMMLCASSAPPPPGREEFSVVDDKMTKSEIEQLTVAIEKLEEHLGNIEENFAATGTFRIAGRQHLKKGEECLTKVNDQCVEMAAHLNQEQNANIRVLEQNSEKEDQNRELMRMEKKLRAALAEKQAEYENANAEQDRLNGIVGTLRNELHEHETCELRRRALRRKINKLKGKNPDDPDSSDSESESDIAKQDPETPATPPEDYKVLIAHKQFCEANHGDVVAKLDAVVAEKSWLEKQLTKQKEEAEAKQNKLEKGEVTTGQLKARIKNQEDRLEDLKEKLTGLTNVEAEKIDLEQKQGTLSDEHAKLKVDLDRLADRVERLEKEVKRWKPAESGNSASDSAFQAMETHVADLETKGDKQDGNNDLKQEIQSLKGAFDDIKNWVHGSIEDESSKATTTTTTFIVKESVPYDYPHGTTFLGALEFEITAHLCSWLHLLQWILQSIVNLLAAARLTRKRFTSQHVIGNPQQRQEERHEPTPEQKYTADTPGPLSIRDLFNVGIDVCLLTSYVIFWAASNERAIWLRANPRVQNAYLHDIQYETSGSIFLPSFVDPRLVQHGLVASEGLIETVVSAAIGMLPSWI